MTRTDVVRRLEQMEKEFAELKIALIEAWPDIDSQEATQAFLRKCGGWEDTRPSEEIIKDIYTFRTVSERGATAFKDES